MKSATAKHNTSSLRNVWLKKEKLHSHTNVTEFFVEPIFRGWRSNCNCIVECCFPTCFKS